MPPRASRPTASSSVESVGSFPILHRFLAQARQVPQVAPFLEPVPWKALGLMDYTKTIKRPMDLGTVGRKLEAALPAAQAAPAGADAPYATAAECAQDIRRVWFNSMAYNSDGGQFYQAAEIMAATSEKLFAACGVDTGAARCSLPTRLEKAQLVGRILRMQRDTKASDEFLAVLLLIAREAPEAIIGGSGAGAGAGAGSSGAAEGAADGDVAHMVLSADSLPPDLFWKVFHATAMFDEAASAVAPVAAGSSDGSSDEAEEEEEEENDDDSDEDEDEAVLVVAPESRRSRQESDGLSRKRNRRGQG